MPRIVPAIALLALATAAHAEKPAKPVEVVNHPLRVDVINAPPAPAAQDVSVVNQVDIQEPLQVEVVGGSEPNCGLPRLVLRDAEDTLVGVVASSIPDDSNINVLLPVSGQEVVVVATQGTLFGFESTQNTREYFTSSGCTGQGYFLSSNGAFYLPSRVSGNTVQYGDVTSVTPIRPRSSLKGNSCHVFGPIPDPLQAFPVKEAVLPTFSPPFETIPEAPARV